MGKILIKKRISLDFLGDEYKECYLEFSTIPLKEYEAMIDKATESEEGKKAIKFIRDTLDSKFIDGKFIEDGELFTVEKDQLSDFDMETVTQVFKSLTGQDQGPKVDSV